MWEVDEQRREVDRGGDWGGMEGGREASKKIGRHVGKVTVCEAGLYNRSKLLQLRGKMSHIYVLYSSTPCIQYFFHA